MFIESTFAINGSDVVLFLVSAIFILGHNLWLVSDDAGAEIKLEVVTSDEFPISESPVKPERIADFRVFSGDDSKEIADYSVEGRSLVARLKKPVDFQVGALELLAHPITLDADKFAGYIRHEAAEAAVFPHFIANETTSPQREAYSKFAKVLFDNTAFGRIVGHRLEIVLRANPSRLDTSSKLPVTVLFDGKPIRNLRVSAGSENKNDGKYTAHALTDENGSAEIEVLHTGRRYLRTHFIRPHQHDEQFEWESFWASVVFND